MVKSGRRVVLTEAGERYFEMIAENIDRIADATQNVRGYLSSQIPDRARHPEPVDEVASAAPQPVSSTRTRISTCASTRRTSRPIFRARASISKSAMARETGPGLFVEGFAEERFLPVCAPTLCAPGTLEASDLPALPPDPLREIAGAMGTLVRGRRGRAPRRRGARVLFDRSHMAIDAAVNGIGIALESDLMMWRELRDGTLVCPLRRPPPASRVTQWLVCPHDRLRRRRVRTFLDWVRAERELWLAARNGQAT